MSRTVKEMIDKHIAAGGGVDTVEAAVAAAYWAGKDEDWRACSNAVREAVRSTPDTRYRNIRNRSIDAVIKASERSDDSEELLNFKFDF